MYAGMLEGEICKTVITLKIKFQQITLTKMRNFRLMFIDIVIDIVFCYRLLFVLTFVSTFKFS